jgi:hypothetical protein
MVIVGALACGSLATVAVISDPFVNSAADFRVEAGWVAVGLAVMLGQMLFWYGVGAVARHVGQGMRSQAESRQARLE